MDRSELRSAQAPLKARYREQPAAAQITLRAEGELGGEHLSCSVQTARALTEAGLHLAAGGDGALACSGDMLLQALVACAGVTLLSVATNRGIRVHGTVHAEGDLDFSGILGVDRTAPVGFSAIRLRFEVESEATPEELDSVLAATEHYCTVYQTLRHSPELRIDRGPGGTG